MKLTRILANRVDYLAKSRYFTLMYGRVLGIVFFLSLSHILLGQMTLHPGNVAPITPDNIIQNVFLGNGIELVDTRFSGQAASIGLFDNAKDVIGLEKGIVLSTGYAQNVIKENNSDTPLSSNTTGWTYQDSDLEALAGVEVVDIVKFNISFVPSSDLVSFRYVFASEEYPDFVCADKNDVFGFFITGKKPGGGNYESQNIALIPDPSDTDKFLDLPVSINSVNNGTAGLFADGACDETNQSLAYAEYYNEVADGMTPALNAYLDVFVAQAAVIPCETYEIKIVLGDGNDQNEDSVVFLEERSFSTGTITIDINNPGVDGGLAEGCDKGNIRLNLPEPVQVDFPLEVECLSGPNLIDAAEEGVDFESLPKNLFIPAGASFLDLGITPIDDNHDEGTEYIYLKIRKSICEIDTLILPLYNNNLETLDLPDTIYSCRSEIFQLKAGLDNSGPNDALTFKSSRSVTLSKSEKHSESSIAVNGLKDIPLNPDLIAEICIDSLVHPRLNDLDIYLRAPSMQVLELSTDNGAREDNEDQEDSFIQTCFKLTATTNINLGNASEGEMNLSNPSYTGDYQPEGSIQDWLYPVTSELNGEYVLFIVDDERDFDGELFSWHISFSPKYDLEYVWSPAAELSCADCETAEGISDESKYFYITLADSYGCEYVDSVYLKVTEEAEEITVECTAGTAGSIEYEISESEHSDFYEYSLDDGITWYSTEDQGTSLQNLDEIEVIDARNIIIRGLLENETLTVLFRANNFAGCHSPEVSSTCTTIPCSSPPVITEIKINQPLCASQEETELTVLVDGSTAPYIYRISINAESIESTTGEFEEIPQGTWTLRVIDNSGCATEQEFTVESPEPLELNEVVKPITCSGDADASISLDAQGAFPPFSYAWNNGNEDAVRTELAPNFYTVTVTDNMGCSAVMDFNILDPDLLVVEYEQSEPLNCGASNVVSASFDISGGVSPYTIIWNGSEESESLDNLAPGIIRYNIEDENGCQVAGEQEVLQVESLTVEFLEVKNLSCYDAADGSVIVNVDNGNGPFDFLWDNGETTDNPQNLESGQNFVTITDQDGCEKKEIVELSSPEEIIIISEVQAPSCFGESDGAITVEIQNVGDAVLQWINGSNETSLTQLAAGQYCLTVTNEDGCTKTECIEVPKIEKLEITSDINNVGCGNTTLGSVDITPSGGSGDYIYSWTGPAGMTAQSEDIENLVVGTYSLALSDRNNPSCSSETFELEIIMASELTAEINILEPILCNGDHTGSVGVTTTGGATPLQFLWSNDGTQQELTNLTAGNYEVTVIDADNCSTIAELVLTEPEPLTLPFTQTDIKCYRAEDGEIVVTPEGGTAPYDFIWNNDASTGALTDLSTGNYSVTVTDHNNCTETEAFEITDTNEEIKSSVETTDVSCQGGANGIITVSSSQGQGPYRYSLNGSQFTSSNEFLNLKAGNYLVTTQDSNGCLVDTEVELNEALPLEVTFKSGLEVIYGQDLQLELAIENQSGSMQYTWDAPDINMFSCISCSDPKISNVTSSFSGSLMITDEENCQSEIFFNVNVIEDGKIGIPTGFSPNGDDVNDLLYVMGDPELTILSFEVFSRWGELLFSAKDFHPGDTSKGWNGTYQGKEMPQDSYVWSLECLMRSGKKERQQGQTTLIK